MHVPFKRFRSRLLFYVIGLLLLVLAGVFAVVNQVFRQNTEASIRHELLVTERVFLRLLSERSRQLGQQAGVLASDFAFKRVIATQDPETVRSALINLSARVRADAAYLVSMERKIQVDSWDRQLPGKDFFAPALLEQAESQGMAASLALLDGKAYQLVAVPILAPEPIAWLCLGFVLDQPVLAQLQQLTQVEISLLGEQNQVLQLLASTRKDAGRQLPWRQTDAEGFFWHDDGERYLSRLLILEKQASGKLVALIERSWPEALASFYRLQWLLLAVALISIALACIAAVWLASTVSKPVQTLAKGVEAIGRGDYGHQVSVTSQDEIGRLGLAFNAMGSQLLEKEKIRKLLGKVVSPAVVNELLSRDLVLGGETREITALFTDLAGFTRIAESMPPQPLVALLNDYLTQMSDAIDRHDGVLDKFIGDAIVAFWGAPVINSQHARQAVACALAMQRRLQAMRGEWRRLGLPPLCMRIGINTGAAVVGNIGSLERLDYTMIGDSVNLASRLEAANKYYGSEILISEQTYRQLEGLFACRELDRVRVQGKQQAVAIYEVIAERDGLSLEQRQLCLLFAEALEAFRNRRFQRAESLFSDLSSRFQDGASALYLRRLQQLQASDTALDFDGVYDLAK